MRPTYHPPWRRGEEWDLISLLERQQSPCFTVLLPLSGGAELVDLEDPDGISVLPLNLQPVGEDKEVAIDGRGSLVARAQHVAPMVASSTGSIVAST